MYIICVVFYHETQQLVPDPWMPLFELYRTRIHGYRCYRCIRTRIHGYRCYRCIRTRSHPFRISPCMCIVNIYHKNIIQVYCVHFTSFIVLRCPSDTYWTNTVFWNRVLRSEFDHRACEVINPTKERGPKTLHEFNNRIIIYLYKIINFIN